MSLFEAVKNMSLDDFVAFLRLLGDGVDDLYCSTVCECNCIGIYDELLPCKDVDALRAVLNADFELFRESIQELKANELPPAPLCWSDRPVGDPPEANVN